MWRALAKAAAPAAAAAARGSSIRIGALHSHSHQLAATAHCAVVPVRSMHVGAAGSSRTTPGRSSGVGGGSSAMRGSGVGSGSSAMGVGASPAAASSAARSAAAAAATKAASEAAAMQQQEEGELSEEEQHRYALDDEVETARVRHFDLAGWSRGGALPPGRVLDINPDDTPLTMRERAGVLAELTIDLPLTMAEFSQLRLAGFTDDGTPIQEPRFPTPKLPPTDLPEGSQAAKEAADEAAEEALVAAAFAEASEWIPAADLAAVLDLQDSHAPPTALKVQHMNEAEKRDPAKKRMGDARRKRYCALVSHTGWLWTRVQLLLDSPADWECGDEVRWRFAAEQLQRCYDSALQCLAYFSMYAVHMHPLGTEATTAMARQSWAALAHVTARMSHTQDESLLVLEHLAQWNADDAEAGTARIQTTSDDVQSETAAVHAFCSAWARSIEAEHAHLRGRAERVADWATELRAGRALDEAEYGLQHYAGEALQSLTRISHALLQEASEEDQAVAAALDEQAASGQEPDPEQAMQQPHFRDVLGAVHAAQYAVGLVWRFASLLDSKSEQLQRHLAEAQCRDSGETELADKLSLSIANAGAAQVGRLVEQHASWAQDDALDQSSLLETAIMQAGRAPKMLEGLGAFFHFMDRVTAETAKEHQWNLVVLSTRNDAAAAHVQLAEALRAWKADAETVRETDPEGALTQDELQRLQQCIDSAVECAEKIAQMEPNAEAVARVQAELEGVNSADLTRIVTDVSSGRDSPV